MIKINLLPTKGKVRKKKKDAQAFPVELVIAIVIVLLCIGGSAFGYSSLSDKVKRLTATKAQKDAELEDLKKKVKEVEALDAQITEIILNQMTIEELKENQSIPVKVVDVLSMVLPPNVWLGSLSLSNYKLQLTGTAFTNTEVVEFVNSLKNARWTDKDKKMFSNVFLVRSSSSQASGGDKTGTVPIYNFAVSLQVDMSKDDKAVTDKSSATKSSKKKGK